ncbi:MULTISPECIES: protein translocase subunit SecD [Maricaulis]|jgi:preprotein translocase subunit SecD|uniref:protein translocase subunit SecD n=1 Tax=Maricaulis TaxID=74317 RepID=UPI000C36672F|nr:protein translocase subunit SecD [Maricaulis sp.]MAC90482.1 protein translocase subunit SecD [Maricaulis sp.]
MLHFGRWKLLSIFLITLLGVMYTIPNFVPEEDRFTINEVDGTATPKGIWRFIPAGTINLGLDLQGGSHIVFEVDMDEVRDAQLETLASDIRTTLRDAPPVLARSVAVIGDEVVVLLVRPEERDIALERIRELNAPVTTGIGQVGLSNMYDIGADPSDPSAIRISVTSQQYESIRNRTLEQSITVIRRRLDGLGTTDPTIARSGDRRVLVQVPGADDPQEIIDLVGTQAAMSFHMVDENVDPGPNGQARTPPGVTVYPMADTGGTQWLAVETRQRLTGENLNSSNVTTHPSYVGPVVGFRLDTQGALIFGELTRANRGRRFAIVLDNEIITAPTINEPILSGSGVIGGSYTYETANQLVILLNAGALPASLTPVEQRVVTGTLGQDQVESGKLAIMIGFALVIVFMVAMYGVFGLFSTMALLVNVVLILGGLSGLGMTLTLPGIAGIILTIGMAVDANVLIYERIREEVLNNRTPVQALQAGYERALAAILDANITTFIAAAVLYMLGAGPVRGFAVTLGIGIITSVFTAFVVSRLLAVLWLRAFKPKKLPL